MIESENTQALTSGIGNITPKCNRLSESLKTSQYIILKP